MPATLSPFIFLFRLFFACPFDLRPCVNDHRVLIDVFFLHQLLLLIVSKMIQIIIAIVMSAITLTPSAMTSINVMTDCINAASI